MAAPDTVSSSWSSRKKSRKCKSHLRVYLWEAVSSQTQVSPRQKLQASPCSWSAARTRACSFSHFRKILGVRGWGGGGGMIPCFWTSASPKRPSSTLSPSKPEALTPKTPNLESFSIPRIRSQSRHGDSMACAGLIPAALLEVS